MILKSTFHQLHKICRSFLCQLMNPLSSHRFWSGVSVQDPDDLASVKLIRLVIHYQHAALVTDTCNKPREAGPCHTYKLQWYHDAHQEKCTQFVYSGCGGNDNNFKTEAECERRCGQVQPTTTDATTAAVTTVVEVVQGQSMSVLSSQVEMGKGKVSPQAICLSSRDG